MVQESLTVTFLRTKASGLMGEDVVVAFSAIVLAGFSACLLPNGMCGCRFGSGLLLDCLTAAFVVCSASAAAMWGASAVWWAHGQMAL